MGDETELRHRDFVDTLPPVKYAFAYGSAAFPQRGKAAATSAKSSMVDYILAVDSPQDWHQQNLLQNRSHYRSSLLALGGGSMVSWVADNIGAGVHFNPYIQFQPDKQVKYGVTSVESLTRDLTSWEALYVSGRMHKPVKLLVEDNMISEMQRLNLRAALAAALLSLPNKFCELSLFLELCGLSYRGDIRTLVGAEDAHKVRAIVEGNVEGFRWHFRDALQLATDQGIMGSTNERGPGLRHYEQSSSKECRQALYAWLPQSVVRQTARRLQLGAQDLAIARSTQQVMEGLSETPCQRAVARTLQSILRRRVLVSSARQAAAGLVTSGAAASVSYVSRKLFVGFISRSA